MINKIKITKFEHSCLLVEMPAPVNRTVLFDPGKMSEQALDVEALQFLDDIVITHIHADHISLDLMKKLVAKFQEVRITTTPEVVEMLQKEAVMASSVPAEGMKFFNSPHATLGAWGEAPQEIGVHYLDKLTVPGDCHSFTETKAVLALPMTAPWGSMVDAIDLALELKPRYIVPVHDWHLRQEARAQFYAGLVGLFKQHDITFLDLQTGVPLVIEA